VIDGGVCEEFYGCGFKPMGGGFFVNEWCRVEMR
jgi:hypothetical protein